MDYLTIITTRSLILFPSTQSLPSDVPAHRPLPDSPLSSPISSTQFILSDFDPSPREVSLPISSLIYNERNCAYFLIQHVLQTSSMNHSVLKQTEKNARESEVKVMVYKELNRAEMFIRGLGRWFNKNSSRIDEDSLKQLANKFGLSLEPIMNMKNNKQFEEHGIGEVEIMETREEVNNDMSQEKNMVLV
ncbi:uncharacterized protein I206_104884 [Kwoniella pini CBS 10737]|uniref:Uncharacterized protein n=1 Tax=Kwoniella pini CBS 10737 TaxID=1296096 RepID=A0A1B9I889_9TREE|nr:uncharacterized protein I206_02424 [Kwoniella pini CBS 10737]OCF51709.1 hypothetical protein I206_02424 [Kwoniella pini CBS 10737]